MAGVGATAGPAGVAWLDSNGWRIRLESALHPDTESWKFEARGGLAAGSACRTGNWKCEEGNMSCRYSLRNWLRMAGAYLVGRPSMQAATAPVRCTWTRFR